MSDTLPWMPDYFGAPFDASGRPTHYYSEATVRRLLAETSARKAERPGVAARAEFEKRPDAARLRSKAREFILEVFGRNLTTPGPWFSTPADEWKTADGEHVQFGRFDISAGSKDPESESYYRIASVSNANDSRQNQANARLIESAPAMLCELSWLHRDLRMIAEQGMLPNGDKVEIHVMQWAADCLRLNNDRAAWE